MPKLWTLGVIRSSLIMDTFYRLNLANIRGGVRLKALVNYDDQALKRGDFRPREPFPTKKDEGRNLYEFVGYQDPFNFAISDMVYQRLAKAELTGWNSYQISIEGKQDEYHGFQVFGKAGELDRGKETGFVIGFNFDQSTWDGSDFFMPAKTMLIFCTAKAAQFLVKNKFRNIEVKDIKSVEHYNSPIKT